jgi:hypothetical protein
MTQLGVECALQQSRARPDQLRLIGDRQYASLTMEAKKAALHLNMTHGPYRGTGQSVPALLGGRSARLSIARSFDAEDLRDRNLNRCLLSRRRAPKKGGDRR